MSPGVKSNSVGFSRRYKAALRREAAGLSVDASKPAVSLGQEALGAGLEVLDLVKIHLSAVTALPPPQPSSSGKDGMIRRTTSFLVAAITPIAKAHRTARKGDSNPKRRTAATQPRDAATAPLRLRLAQEIDRRKTAQTTLKKWEAQYTELLARSERLQAHLRRLSHEILSAQERERKRISRELHDEIGQTLAAISVTLATLTKRAVVDTADLTKRIANTQRLVKRSMDTVHRFARELRPPLLDDLGLIPALQSFMREYSKRTQLRVHLRVVAAAEQLSDDKRTVLYRVIQEALANVVSHARATEATVRIHKVADDIELEVHDNGKGFDVNRVLSGKKLKRLGVLGMRERVEMVGGSFSIDSAPVDGTTVRAKIPFSTTRVRSRPPKTERNT